jgi:putative membrane protein
MSGAKRSKESEMHYAADMMGDWGSGWWGWPMWIGMIAFWGGLVALIAWVIKGLATGGAHTSPPSLRESPQDILKRRYAAGEIDREEFEQKKRELF